MSEVQLHKKENMEKWKKIASLENRVADLEQYPRMNDIIIYGSNETTEAEAETSEQKVVGLRALQYGDH